jgi:hypothetical protein
MAGTIRLQSGTAPATPPSGHIHLYSKTDKKLYFKDDSGTEFELALGSSITNTDDLPEGVVNLYFTAERAQDAVGSTLVSSPTITLTYDDTAATITAVVVDGSLTNAKISTGAAIAVSKLAALTATRAVVTDGSGVLTTSTTTATEIGYLSGVTSAVQTQINDINTVLSASGVQEFFVEKNGNDITGTGSYLKPFLTIQRAATAIGTAASSADYEDPTKRFWAIRIGNGVYTENVTIGTRMVVVFDFKSAQLVGDVTVSFDKGKAAAATLRQPQYIFLSSDLRPAFTGSNMPLSGITGNINWSYINGGASVTCQVHLIHTGVSGNITTSLGAGGTNNGVFQVYATEAYISGQVQIGTGSGSVFLDSCGDDTVGLGGITGTCRLQMLRNVRFSGTISVTGSQTGAQWYNTSFITGSSMTGSSGNISADANSYQSYFTNVTAKGTETFTFLDTTRGIAYSPTTAADWATAPTTAQAALDSLAASRVADTITANQVLASPDGSSGLPSFRSLAPNDLPVLTGLTTSFGQLQATDTVLQAFSKLNGSQALQPQQISSDFIVPTGYNLIRSETTLSGSSTLTLEGTATLRLI